MNLLANGKAKWHEKKDPFVYPHLEDFHPLVYYAVSISPNHLMRGMEGNSLVEAVSDLFNQIMPCFAGAEYVIRPEISTKSTILHYHGTIMWKNRMDITNFYWRDIRRLKSMCTFTIKTIDNPDDWHKYVIKQRLHMKDWMQSQNIRYRLTQNNKSPYVKIKNNKVSPLDKPSPIAVSLLGLSQSGKG